MEKYQIFISYRRDGGYDLAGRLADRFSRMGFSVFFDVESMRSGHFNTQLYDAIDRCKDVLLILPPNGLDRCNNPEDWVRKELEYAIRQKKNIIPVLMRGFDFPQELPEEIASIKTMQGVEASQEYFDAAIDRIKSYLVSKTSNPSATVESLRPVLSAVEERYQAAKNHSNADVGDCWNETFKEFFEYDVRDYRKLQIPAGKYDPDFAGRWERLRRDVVELCKRKYFTAILEKVEQQPEVNDYKELFLSCDSEMYQLLHQTMKEIDSNFEARWNKAKRMVRKKNIGLPAANVLLKAKPVFSWVFSGGPGILLVFFLLSLWGRTIASSKWTELGIWLDFDVFRIAMGQLFGVVAGFGYIFISVCYIIVFSLVQFSSLQGWMRLLNSPGFSAVLLLHC